MSDVLLERIAVALEKIAGSGSSCAAEPAKRGRPRKEETAEVGETPNLPAPTMPPAQPVKLAPAQAGGFLDDEEEPAVVSTATTVVPTATASGSAALLEGKNEKEQRDVVRKHMISLQKALDPERALKVMKAASGGAETLISVKVEKYVDVLDAIAAAMPK